LATEITVEDQLVKGLKLSFDTQFVPQTGYVTVTGESSNVFGFFFVLLFLPLSINYLWKLQNLEPLDVTCGFGGLFMLTAVRD
jgi:hypothetical protein